MKRLFQSLLLLRSLPLLLAVLLIRLPADGAAEGGRVISGVVVNAVTGRPVENADVTLRESDSNIVSMDATTDTDGRFVFSGLADGQYSIRASHRGYIAATLDEHDGYSTAIVTGADLDTTGIRFALAPQGVIYGTVVEDTGDPVHRATITLYRQDRRTGVERTVRVGGATTDDLGHYEVTRLTPGSYYVSVTARPWYATHPRGVIQADGTPTELPRSPLDVAYAKTFYPDTPDSDEATPILVKAGDRVPINFGLHPVPAVQITLQVPKTNGMPMPQLRQQVFGDSEPSQGAPNIVTMGGGRHSDEGGTSTVVVNGVAPGEYTLSLDSPHGGGGKLYMVDVAGSVATLRPVDGGTSVDMRGIVAMEDGGNLPSGLSLSLLTPQGETEGYANPDAKGNFSLHGLPPGEYELHMNADGVAVGIAGGVTGIKLSGATVTGNLLKIGTTPVMMAAMLTASRASLRGYARVGDRAMPGAMIVLVPVSAAGVPLTGDREIFRRDQSNSDGSFEFKQVLPGRYIVVGIEDGWELEWGVPDVISRYLAKGLKVTVVSGGSDVRLQGPVEVQAK